MKNKWTYIVASLLVLVGGTIGGIFGGLAAAFAGDSWWKSDTVLNLFQYAITFGGVCLGATPGMVWLLWLGQNWVLPFLGAAAFALVLPILENMPLRNDSMGMLYAGAVATGAGLGFLLWINRKKRICHGGETITHQ